MDLRQALEIVSLTDPGKVRSHNEDNITTDNEVGFVILADGMGGYNAGEVASGIAVTMLANGLKTALSVRLPEQAPARPARKKRNRKNQWRDLPDGTKPAAVLGNGYHTGLRSVPRQSHHRRPCRRFAAVPLSAKELSTVEQITRDHSLLQEQIDSGMISREDARLSSNKNLVTRALGVDRMVDVEVQEHEAMPGDVYLLCSDGLNDMVGDEEIQLTLRALGTNLELAAQQLVQMANDNGGRDNVSVILVRILRNFPARRGFFAWLSAWLKK